MGYNKFVLRNGTELLNLSNDTVTEEDVPEGVTFHGRDGELHEGTSPGKV